MDNHFKAASGYTGRTLLGSIFGFLAVCLTLSVTQAFADPIFYSTSAPDASHWQVATNIGGTDGLITSFPTTGFVTATPVTNRSGWIANNSTGTNGACPACTWVFFVFRQTFDLAGYDPSTVDLKFQWAADDSGEGFYQRGTWVPKFSLNGGSLIPWGTGSTYSLGPTVDLSTGFVAGVNEISFYVEGNSRTDGFELSTVSFTANPASSVPEPDSFAMMLSGLSLLGFASKRRKLKPA